MPETSDDPPPAKRLKTSPDTEKGHEDALVAGHLNVKKGSQLTSLAPELFKMIMDRTVDPEDHQSFKNMLGKRSVCRLFNAEILEVATRNRNEAGTAHYWSRRGPMFMKMMLLKSRLSEKANYQSLLLTTIDHVVKQIQHLKKDQSEKNRRRWIHATCECIVFNKDINEGLHSKLRARVDESENGQRALQEDVQRSCWAVIAWSGDVPLLEKLESEQSSAPPTHKDECPRFIGSAQWAVAYKGHCHAIRYLLTQGFDFGKTPRNRPLVGAIDRCKLEAFKLLLSTSTQDFTEEIEGIGLTLARLGRVEWAEFFWAERVFNKASANLRHLITLCRIGRQNHAKMAEILIEAGAPVNDCYSTRDGTPLAMAIRKGPPELVRALIENGARIRAGRFNHPPGRRTHVNPIEIAIECQNEEAVKIILEYGHWQKLTDKNLLLAAITAGIPELRPGQTFPSPPGHIGILELLLQDFDPDRTPRARQMGRGAMARARAGCDSEILDMLVEHGCEPELERRPRRRKGDKNQKGPHSSFEYGAT